MFRSSGGVSATEDFPGGDKKQCDAVSPDPDFPPESCIYDGLGNGASQVVNVVNSQGKWLQGRLVGGVGTNYQPEIPFASSKAYYPAPFNRYTTGKVANDIVNISGHLTYNLGVKKADPSNTASITPDDLEDWLGSTPGAIPNTNTTVSPVHLFSNFIGINGKPSAPCNSDKCSFNGVSSAILAGLIQESSSQLAVCPGSGQTKQDGKVTLSMNRVCMPNTGPNPAKNCKDLWPSDPTDPNGKYVASPCVHYTDSWWYGGEAYLSLNKLMSSNLKQLAKDVASLQLSVNAHATINNNDSSVSGTSTAFIAEEQRSSPKLPWTLVKGSLIAQKITVSLGPSGSSPVKKGTTTLKLPDWTSTVNYLLFGNTFTGKGAIDSSKQWTQDQQNMTTQEKALYQALMGSSMANNPSLQRPF